MERYVAFDIGDRRIGVAVSDPFNTYALPSHTYFRKGFRQDIAALAAIAAEKGATAIVCGLPVNFDGSESVQTQKTAQFIRELKAAVSVPVRLAAGVSATMSTIIVTGATEVTASFSLESKIFSIIYRSLSFCCFDRSDFLSFRPG